MVDDRSLPERLDTAFDVAASGDLPSAAAGSAPDPKLDFADSLICFSHLRWDFVFQRPQHLMRRFAGPLLPPGMPLAPLYRR